MAKTCSTMKGPTTSMLKRGPNYDEQRFCSVLGCWMEKRYKKCAHIVPKSLKTKNLGYIFGAQDAALCSPRNGLIIYQVIEVAFDNG